MSRPLQGAARLPAGSGLLQGNSACGVSGCHRCLRTHVPHWRHWLHHHRLWLLGFWGETRTQWLAGGCHFLFINSTIHMNENRCFHGKKSHFVFRINLGPAAFFRSHQIKQLQKGWMKGGWLAGLQKFDIILKSVSPDGGATATIQSVKVSKFMIKKKPVVPESSAWSHLTAAVSAPLVAFRSGNRKTSPPVYLRNTARQPTSPPPCQRTRFPRPFWWCCSSSSAPWSSTEPCTCARPSWENSSSRFSVDSILWFLFEEFLIIPNCTTEWIFSTFVQNFLDCIYVRLLHVGTISTFMQCCSSLCSSGAAAAHTPTAAETSRAACSVCGDVEIFIFCSSLLMCRCAFNSHPPSVAPYL